MTYYDSKDASGSAVEVYDEATVTSNSGTVSFDRSVYPVPFARSGDLKTGAGGSGTTDQTEAGNVTMTITVSDSDFTSDTLTTSGSGAPGTILVKLIEGSTTNTCFTAGSAASGTLHKWPLIQTTFVEELGPLIRNFNWVLQVYEIDIHCFDEVQHCADGSGTTAKAGYHENNYFWRCIPS